MISRGGGQQVGLLEPLMRNSTSELVELVWYSVFEEYIDIFVRFGQMAEPEPWSHSRLEKYWTKTGWNQTMAALAVTQFSHSIQPSKFILRKLE